MDSWIERWLITATWPWLGFAWKLKNRRHAIIWIMILYNLLHQIFIQKPGPWHVGLLSVMIVFNAGALIGALGLRASLDIVLQCSYPRSVVNSLADAFSLVKTRLWEWIHDCYPPSHRLSVLMSNFTVSGDLEVRLQQHLLLFSAGELLLNFEQMLILGWKSEYFTPKLKAQTE